MSRVEITQEHRDLIESIIKTNPKYLGYEHFMDIFVDVVYKKSYLLLDSIKDMDRLRRHLIDICDDSINQVIQENKMYNDIGKKEVELMPVSSESQSGDEFNDWGEATDVSQEENHSYSGFDVVNLKGEVVRNERYAATDNLVDPVDYYPQKRVGEEEIDRLIQIVKAIDKRYPKKNYWQIFSQRYIRKINHVESARRLNISQAELSKRFVELIKLTKEYN